MIEFIRSFFKKKPCDHKRDYLSKTWIENNTPMVKFECYECGYSDEGHVYADVEKWETKQIRVKIR